MKVIWSFPVLWKQCPGFMPETSLRYLTNSTRKPKRKCLLRKLGGQPSFSAAANPTSRYAESRHPHSLETDTFSTQLQGGSEPRVQNAAEFANGCESEKLGIGFIEDRESLKNLLISS